MFTHRRWLGRGELGCLLSSAADRHARTSRLRAFLTKWPRPLPPSPSHHVQRSKKRTALFYWRLVAGRRRAASAVRARMLGVEVREGGRGVVDRGEHASALIREAMLEQREQLERVSPSPCASPYPGAVFAQPSEIPTTPHSLGCNPHHSN